MARQIRNSIGYLKTRINSSQLIEFQNEMKSVNKHLPMINEPQLLKQYDFVENYLKKIDKMLKVVAVDGPNYQHPIQRIKINDKQTTTFYGINTKILHLLSDCADEINGQTPDEVLRVKTNSYIDIYRLSDEGLRIKEAAVINNKTPLNKLSTLTGHFYNALAHIILADPIKNADLLHKIAGALRYYCERQFDWPHDKLGRVCPWPGVTLKDWESIANASSANTFGVWCQGIFDLKKIKDQPILDAVYWFGFYFRVLQNLKEEIDSFANPKLMIKPFSAPVIVYLEQNPELFKLVEQKMQEKDLKLKDLRAAINNSKSIDACRNLIPKYKTIAFDRLNALPNCASKAFLQAIESIQF